MTKTSATLIPWRRVPHPVIREVGYDEKRKTHDLVSPFGADHLWPCCATAPALRRKRGRSRTPTPSSRRTISDGDSLDPAYAYDTASTEQDPGHLRASDLLRRSEAPTSLRRYCARNTTSPMMARPTASRSARGSKFHNGDDLTPEDVEYTFERGMVSGLRWRTAGVDLRAAAGCYRLA